MTHLSRKIVKTADGSHTLAIPEMDEHYHSVHGAIQESTHVYINSGIKWLENFESISLLEIGFGTALNALLTLKYALDKNKKIHFTSLEKYPLCKDEYQMLNYGKQLDVDLDKAFLKMHACEWEKPITIQPNFVLHKKQVDLLKFNSSHLFNGIYFDAFAPEKQPALWSATVFRKMYALLLPGGFLITYCAKGQVRRNMQSVGFRVERIPGPPGKREMLRAIKD